MSPAPVTLQAALAHLPARHRRAVAQSIGAGGEDPASIANLLADEARLDRIVQALPDEARVAVTELAFKAVDIWSPRGGQDTSRQALHELEQRGLALCYRSAWSIEFMAPLELVAALRRVRARAHARRIPDVSPPAHLLPSPEQLLHDAAAVGTRIAHGEIQLKVDGELYAKAYPKLLQALPPVAVPELDLGEKRVGLALALLQELGTLRVHCDDLPGQSARRELQLDTDLVTLLAVPFAERAALTRVLRRRFPDLSLIDPVLDALGERTVGLDALGNELATLFAAARKVMENAGLSAFGVGLAAVQMRALSGGARIGLDGDGHPVTVTLTTEPPPGSDKPPYVAQGDFELIALREPLPHERAAVLLLCEPVAGREHVVRVTRERILSATRVLRSRDPEAILGRLRSLAHELPQNVERSVADWVGQASPRARLRSVILVDVGERELGDRVAGELGPLLAERLGPGLLAVVAEKLTAVQRAVRRAGIELEPGLDRVSGSWHDRVQDGEEADWWRPTQADGEGTVLPTGQIVSGLEQEPESDWAARQRNRRDALLITVEPDPELDTLLSDRDELTPEALLVESYESGILVELRYAGAGGTISEHVTVAELDEGRVLVEDPHDGEQHWRWLKSVVDVQPSDLDTG